MIEGSQFSVAGAGELRDFLLGVLGMCPIERCNPRDCPLHELRNMEPAARLRWFAALNRDDLAYLAAYHFACVKAHFEAPNVFPAA